MAQVLEFGTQLVLTVLLVGSGKWFAGAIQVAISAYLVCATIYKYGSHTQIPAEHIFSICMHAAPIQHTERCLEYPGSGLYTTPITFDQPFDHACVTILQINKQPWNL